VGVTMGAINGRKAFSFAGAAPASNSGLKHTGSWATPIQSFTLAIVFKMGATMPSPGAVIWYMGPSTHTGTDDAFLVIQTNGTLQLVRRRGTDAVLQSVMASSTVAANQLCKVVCGYDTSNGRTFGYLNSGALATTGAYQTTWASPATSIVMLGQAPSGFSWGIYTGNVGFNGQIGEQELISGVLNSTDIATFQNYQTAQFG